MKVLIFAAFYHPYKGGYVESIHELSKNLLERGYEITIITCNTHNLLAKETIKGVNLHRVSCWNPTWLNSSYPIPRPIASLNLLINLSKNKYGFILTNTRFFPITWLGFFYGKIFGIYTIHIERGGQHTQTNNVPIVLIGKFIDHTLGFLVVRFSDVVVGVSEAVCSFLLHLGSKKPIKIFNGINTNFDQNVVYDNKIPCVITFVGRLIHAKGLKELVGSLPFLSADVIVQIIGGGPYRKDLEEVIKNLRLENRVVFLGELDHRDVMLVLLKTTIFINPSYSEGLPRCVLEAGLVGLPVIATDVGGTREIICDEEHGILIAAKSVEAVAMSINKLIKDVGLREKLGRNLKKRVRTVFNWNEIILKYEKECFNTHNIL